MNRLLGATKNVAHDLLVAKHDQGFSALLRKPRGNAKGWIRIGDMTESGPDGPSDSGGGTLSETVPGQGNGGLQTHVQPSYGPAPSYIPPPTPAPAPTYVPSPPTPAPAPAPARTPAYVAPRPAPAPLVLPSNNPLANLTNNLTNKLKAMPWKSVAVGGTAAVLGLVALGLYLHHEADKKHNHRR